MNWFDHALTVALTAMAIDAAIGWPAKFYDKIGHPVVWLGRLISGLEKALNRSPIRFLGGAITVAVVLVCALLPAWLLTSLIAPLPFGSVILGVLAWPLVATRSLYDHVAAVADPLEAGDLPAARQAAAMIVGRDLGDDPAPIARAALESLAENASDGVIAPLFWAAVGGLAGIALYKAINTMDSMIGHRSPRYEQFGKLAARLDDVVNLPASRLTGGLFVLASLSPKAWRVMRRDAGRHRSPNAGWPEGAMAGALNVRLSGPRSYSGKVTQEPWLNETARDPSAKDLKRGLGIYVKACLLMGTLLILLRLI